MVVYDEVHLDFILYSLIYDFSRVLDHLRIQHAAYHFVKWEGFGIGFLVAHSKGGNEPDDHLLPRVRKFRSDLGKQLPQRGLSEPKFTQKLPLLYSHSI